MIGIYKFENLVNHKIYIGQSLDIERRYKDHITRAMNNFISNTEYNSSIHRAIRKYGLQNFSFTILEECSKEELNNKEIYWIEYYHSYNNGYNQTKGGNQYSHYKYSQEQIDNVIHDLLHTSLSYDELHNKYGISTGMISEINAGKRWVDNNLSYPLREKTHKKVTLCKMCNTPIDNKSTYCVKCYAIKRRVSTRPDRDTLKQLIRTNTFVNIGKQYGVSDNAIKKWCDSYNLPRTKKDIKSYSNEEWDKI